VVTLIITIVFIRHALDATKWKASYWLPMTIFDISAMCPCEVNLASHRQDQRIVSCGEAIVIRPNVWLKLLEGIEGRSNK
jgi:hypothetical protein